MSLRKQTLDGNMETLLLAVLGDGPSYGYQIVNQLNDRAIGLLDLGEGTVYPVLHRLEKRGLIAAAWREGENGRRRKYYRLTPKGRKSQQENLRQWQGLMQLMQGVIGPAPTTELKHQGEPA